MFHQEDELESVIKVESEGFQDEAMNARFNPKASMIKTRNTTVDDK